MTAPTSSAPSAAFVPSSRTEASARKPIRPRSPRFDFSQVSRHWFAGNALLTHSYNGLNLLFPAGERFFVRSVRRYLDRIADPTLKEDIKGFFGQEGRHASAHEDLFAELEKQGYRIRPFLKFYEWFAYGIVERVASDELRLSATAACEHFTATLACHALERDDLGESDPTMRALFLWHAVEEIEHKTVAFDVLREVNPSYALRMAGLALAGVMLGTLWGAAAVMLLAQDRVSPRRLAADIRAIRKHREQVRSAMPPADEASAPAPNAIRAYMRRDFHPSQKTRDRELAGAYIAKAGLQS